MPEPRTTDATVSIEKHPTRAGWRLHATQWLPKPVDEVWPFFTDAYNLEELTPPLLNFNVITPKPIEMKAGALIDYKLKIRGVPAKWRTEISLWEPGSRFMDRQLKGPYRWWEHEHRFEAKDHGTLCTDIVEYNVPGFFLAPLINAMVVQNDIRSIFAFRSKVLADKFG